MRRLLLLCPCLLLLLAACGGPAVKNAPAGQIKTTFPASGKSPDVAIESVSYLTSSEGEVSYIGEVTNTSQAPISNIEITLVFVDGGGKQLAQSTFLNPGLPMLKPGEKSPWKLFVGKMPVGWAETQASIQIEPSEGDNPTYVPLSTEGVELAPPGKSAWVTGSGRVVNPTNQPLMGMLLLLGLYDGSGKLLDVTEAITADKQLGANGATGFTADFRETKQIPASFKVYAMGNR